MIISFILGALFCLLSGVWLIAKNMLPLWSQGLLDLTLWALWLGSGCLAATIAELLDRRVLPHAFLGLCLPYIYPICLVHYSRRKGVSTEIKLQQQEQQRQAERKEELSSRFQAMQEKREQERRERIAVHQGISTAEVAAMEEAALAAQAPEEPVSAAEEQTMPPPAAEAGSEIYQLLYVQPVDENGVRQGPFQFTLVSGDMIDIAGIRELQQDIMICTVYGTGKSVRIKYTQVESIARYETE